jgi:predicted nucleic acid-binding protein
MIVADAGPIIAFARIGRLDLLQHVAKELLIPEAVYEELVLRRGACCLIPQGNGRIQWVS